jgi:hypothetical protein
MREIMRAYCYRHNQGKCEDYWNELAMSLHWLDDQWSGTKGPTAKSEKTNGGGEFHCNQLAHDLLRTRVYIGFITTQGETSRDLHGPFVEEGLFERGPKRLDESTVDSVFGNGHVYAG